MKTAKIIRGKEASVKCVCIVGLFLVVMVSVGFSMMAATTSADDAKVISILHRQSQILKTPWKVVRVAITDPTIADVRVLTPDQILVQGLKIGTTDIILWNEGETQILQKKVSVVLDVEAMQKVMGELFPSSELMVSQSGGSLILKGHHKNAKRIPYSLYSIEIDEEPLSPPLPLCTTGTGNSPPARKPASSPLKATSVGVASKRKY